MLQSLLLWLVLLPASLTAKNASQSVVVYCAQDQVYAEPIFAQFTQQTGIRVKPLFDSEAVKTAALANRLLAERRNPKCDIFWGNEELRTRQLAAANVFRETNGWIAFGQRSRRLVISSNSPVRPTTLVELTNSIWRGRISLALPLFGSTCTHFLVLRQAWGESQWREWCRALEANHPFLEEGNSHVVGRVLRGEAWVGLTDSDDIAARRREGKWTGEALWFPESLRLPNTIAVIRGAPNPSAAQRLFEFLASQDVLAQLVKVGALERPEDESGAIGLNPDWGGIVSSFDDGIRDLKEIFRK
jgi:iron(III) transport system substrate-binding protein